MTTIGNSYGVTGSDGQMPVYAPNERWCIWSLTEIYTGAAGASKWVPKVGDYIVNTVLNEWYKVTLLNSTTLTPTMVLLTGSIPDQQMSAADILLGAGPGTISDTFRVYIDKRVRPFALTVDRRLSVFGSDAVNAKLFIGSDLTGNPQCISAVYNSGGTLTGQSIALEQVVDSNGSTIPAQWIIPTCNTTVDLPNNEVVSAIIYNSAGNVISKCALLVENTSFISNAVVSQKYITGISLQSPFLSESNPLLIQFPLNVPLNGLSLIGVVSYSDGSTESYPVDGTKFSIFGFDSFVATIEGQTLPLVLKYALGDNELTYVATSGTPRSITAAYTATCTRFEGQYTPKLYPFPVWIDGIQGYRLEWFFYDADRNISTCVTSLVTLTSTSPPWQPLAYGTMQNLVASIDIESVYPGAGSWIFVQTVGIVLRNPGTNVGSDWAIAFSPNQSPLYGENNTCNLTEVSESLTNIDITCGETVLANWLNRLYYSAQPLFNPERETQAPAPNFFSIGTTTWETTYPIGMWNTVLGVTNCPITNASTMYVKFISRTADIDLQLAIAGLPAHVI